MQSSTRPTRRSRKAFAATAGIAALALTLTACGSSDDGDDAADGGDSDAPVTLTIATFNDFGYTQDLLDAYTEEHPNVTIKHTIAATSDDAKANFTTKLAAGGAGLADIQAVDIDWMPIVQQYEDLFTDLSDPSLDGRWLDWKTTQGSSNDGSKLLGYGTDIGPEAICYRQDLFEAAGLPSDPDGVAELLGGADATWDKYFEVGKDFVSKSDGVAWFDSAEGVYQAMVGQIEEPYENASDGTAKDLASNTDIKDLFTTVATMSKDEGLAAPNQQWSDDWNKAFQNDGFATMACPAWMTGSIETNSGGVDGWNIANVFPGGGGNWGGSFLVVPASGAHTQAAKDFAAWLTAPEQQTAAFNNSGNFPSQVEAEASEEVTSATNDFFNDAPVGKIYTDRAAAVTVTPFKGPNYFSINSAVTNALVAYDVQGKGSIESNWDDAVKAYEALGIG
ncbi:cellobiose-binding protein [Sediminihabitans luteus]|uniref:Cellobiose-binding protein n=1 Tax=Sediminihabitans luteus TaxID=1138585 RepID=A0A2M9CDN2_9CELL|nr:extracellular solute-binding protein [Sediminihabitans luteus]PJJ69960.1 cellobiose-binding protein [Sediminihabitans luteus]GII99280.1 sugar ABC transporter substrate-binding protein [Sediminihabitans luteus]